VTETHKVSWTVSAGKGATAGLSAWLVYGLLEFALAVALPRLWSSEAELLPWQWPLVALLFAVYAAVGLLSGALGGVWLARGGRIPQPEDHRNLACAILAFAFAINLALAWPLARSEDIALAMAAALGAMFCAALRAAAWRRRTAFLAVPGILSLLLLIGPWMDREVLSESSAWVRVGAALLAVAGMAGIAGFWHRVTLKPAYKAWGAAAGVAMVGVLGAGIQGPGIAAGSTVPAAAGRPNILLVTMDTVRADHVSVYGYARDTTPNLRAFAKESTVYDRAMATAGFTLPTHASMFTGLYPAWHRAEVSPAHPFGGPLPPRSRTLASMLRAAGYWTAEAVANYGYLGKSSGLTQGFALTDARLAAHLSDSDRPFYLREGARKLLSAAMNTDGFDEYRLRAADIDRHASTLLEQARSQQRPFFVFLNYMDAHVPYLPPPQFRDKFSAGDPALKPISAKEYLALRDAVNDGKRVLTEEEKRYLVSQYDAGIASIDAAIGDLLARLRELGLYENTLIIITSDHGEAFGEHNRMEHAIGSVYQDQLHVPLLVKYPGQQEARRVDALVSEVDFLPTVLELAGIAAPAGLQGQSLRAPRGDSGAVFAQSEARGSQRENPRLRGARRAIFSGNLKLIVWTAGNPELYDVAADPGELHNLYNPADASAEALEKRMHEWLAAMPVASSPHTVTPADKSTVQKLRSLGYVQ